MKLVEWLQRIMVGFGAEWVMWLMIGLSVISVAIMLERAWFFWSLRDDLVTLARDLRTSLDQSIEAAQKRMEASPSAEAAVVSAGMPVVPPIAAESIGIGAVVAAPMPAVSVVVVVVMVAVLSVAAPSPPSPPSPPHAEAITATAATARKRAFMDIPSVQSSE